jgi:hypothetical protein
MYKKRVFFMKKLYSKPELFITNEPHGVVPLAILVGLGAAVAGVAAGAAVGAGISAGAALAKKASSHDFGRLERLSALDIVEVYA